jgi:hypothetical protein
MDIAGEVDKAKRAVRTDAYQMSFGEVVNLYQDHDLIINPEFQRLFRWTNSQKSRLIESILLGIPIPPIFVYELPEGKWELVGWITEDINRFRVHWSLARRRQRRNSRTIGPLANALSAFTEQRGMGT